MPRTRRDGHSRAQPREGRGRAADGVEIEPVCSARAAVLAILVAVAAMALPVLAGDTIDPDNDGSQYAWAENVGWLNAEPSGDGGPGMRVLESRVEGWLWSENVGWISLSCHNTGSCSTVAFEVLHDGSGGLTGYGWSENAGWISFSCENTGSCATVDYGVTVDPASGELAGFAWSENLGWVSFSCENTGSCATVEFRVKTEVPFPEDVLFADSFESGDTGAWSATLP
jgi:hypothetical protein